MASFWFKLSLCLVTLLGMWAPTVVTYCPAGWEEYTFKGTESCYRVYNFQQIPKTWQEAEDYCEALNNDCHLVSINAVGEIPNVKDAFDVYQPNAGSAARMWMGLRETEGGLQYSDGSTGPFVWAANEPKLSGIVFIPHTSNMEVSTSTTQQYFMCKRPGLTEE